MDMILKKAKVNKTISFLKRKLFSTFTITSTTFPEYEALSCFIRK